MHWNRSSNHLRTISSSPVTRVTRRSVTTTCRALRSSPNWRSFCGRSSFATRDRFLCVPGTIRDAAGLLREHGLLEEV